MTVLIREMSPEERPRERLLKQGAAALKTSELIAILLRTGTQGQSVVVVAETLLRSFDSLEALGRASPQQLAKIKGIGPAKAIELVAAFTLGARLSRSVAESRAIETPEDVYALLGEEMRLLDHELVRVISINTKHKILGIDDVTRGTLNESLFHPREAFLPAISRKAYGIILVHNHPSGDPTPSRGDHAVTRQLKQASDVLQIPVLDHIIIGSPRPKFPQPYYSFKEGGFL